MYIVGVISRSKICGMTAMCKPCSDEHTFQAIGGILYIISFSCCEVRGFVCVSHLSPYLCPTYVDFPILPHPIISMTSTVTISAACDSTLGSEHQIVNCICILIATHGDGTVFSHNSFQEEDLVRKLCVGLGQAHLEGVLQISVTESSSCILIYLCIDGCDTSLRCGHGLAHQTYKTLCLSSY